MTHAVKSEHQLENPSKALSTRLVSKCPKTIHQKGNALLGLGRFDEAKDCYESLRSLGDAALADACLKKLHDIQECDIIKHDFVKTMNSKNHIEQFPKPVSKPIKKKGKKKK